MLCESMFFRSSLTDKIPDTTNGERWVEYASKVPDKQSLSPNLIPMRPT